MTKEKEEENDCKGIDRAVESLIDTSTLAAAIAEPEEFVDEYCEEKRIEKRRPRIKHRANCKEKTLSCLKITCVYMLSYVGLTCIVVGYSILGGILFRALEEANEERVEQKALETRINFTNALKGNISTHDISLQEDFAERLDKLGERALAFMEDEITRNMQMFNKNVTNHLSYVIKEVLNQTEIRNAQNQSLYDQNRTLGVLKSKQNFTKEFLNFYSGSLIKKTRNSVRASIRNASKSLRTSLQNGEISLDESKIHKFQLDTYELVNTEGWNGVDPNSDEGAKWTYAGGLLYSVTVITTIGYGTITPKTDAGRALTILYALIGIPLTVLCITNIGRGMAAFTRALYGGTFCVECRQQLFNSIRTRRLSSIAADDIELDKIDQDCVSQTEVIIHNHGEVPVYLSLILVTLYILFGAIMFKFWEDNWSISESAYFCFITLSTIGFGDFVPGFSDKDWDNQVKQIACSLYLLIGLSTLAMCFELMQQRCKEFANRFASFIGLVKKY